MAKDKLQALYQMSRMPFELGRYDTARIGRDEEMKRLGALISSGRQSKSPIIGVLLGTYGSGKSFLLWHVAKHYANAIKSRVLVSQPIRLIDPEQKRDFLKNIVIRLFKRGFRLETIAALMKAAAESSAALPKQAERFAPVLLALADESRASVATRILHGGRTTRSEAVAARFSETIYLKTNDDAIELLQTLQILVRRANVEAVTLLIDEVEFIDGLPRSQRGAVFDSIKHLWDQEVTLFSNGVDAAQLVMVLAATPAFWQERMVQIRSEGRRSEATVGLTPFFSRVPQDNQIAMPSELAPAEARQLIVSRMSEVRDGSGAEKLIPFTDDYVNYVYELSHGLPRTIIEICATVVTEAAARGLKKIDKGEAKNILKDLLIVYEPVAPAAT